MKKTYLFVFLFTVLFSASNKELIENLANSTHTLNYFFWASKNNNIYLMKQREGDNNSLWNYTNDRKWKPLHNADAFDGFVAQKSHFESVVYDNGVVKASNLSKDGYAQDIATLNENIEGKDNKVAYFFWTDKKNISYLVKEIEDNNYSIWHYTTKRKWKPLYNTLAFDGFALAGETLSDVVLDKKAHTLSIGEVIKNEESDKASIKLSSSSIKEDKLNPKNYNITPAFSWEVSEKIKDRVQYYVLQIRDSKDSKLIWSYVANKETYSIKEGSDKTNTVLPKDNFCYISYDMGNTKDTSIDLEINIYALSDKSLIDEIACYDKIKDSNIAKDTIIAKIDVPLLSNKHPIQWLESDKNDGSIKEGLKLEFKNNIFNEFSDDFKDLITLKNIPDDLIPSYDLIDKTTLLINLTGKATSHDSGVIEVSIELDSKLWKNVQTKQIISAQVVFDTNALSIADIKQEPYYKHSWHQHSTDFMVRGKKSLSDSHIGMEKTWAITRGKGVKVAVIDTTFDLDHYDLQNIKLSYNSETGGNYVSPQGSGGSHGTSVIGTIVASVNGLGTVGVAPEATGIAISMPLRTTLSTIISTFEFAKKNGAQVINCSWGSESYRFVSLLAPTLQDMHDSGITVLFASGNSNKLLQQGEDESTLPSVISVGGSNEFNEKVSYSNYGADMDIVSPGGEVGVPTTDVIGSRGYNSGNDRLLNSDYAFARGTSFSSPIAAGVVALMISVNPDLTPKQIRQILIDTADKIAGGYDENGFSYYTAYGKVNAYKAVLKAKDYNK